MSVPGIRRFESGPRLSKVVVANGTVYISGLTAKDKLPDVAAQTRDILEQIEHYLRTAGTDKSHLVKAQIWLVDLAGFADMNSVWTAWIDPENPPARATVQAALAGNGNLVEISATAVLPQA